MSEFNLALLDEQCSKFTSVNRRIADTIYDERNGTDVIQVTVGDDQAFNLVLIFFEVFDVRQNIVNARSLFITELDTAVNDNDFVLEFKGGHVSADFLESAERNDADVVADWWNVE